jgi:16S rRNA (guanine527-N7)-methyltransferase
MKLHGRDVAGRVAAMNFASDRAAALNLVPVSRETERRFALYVELLAKWRKITNLISEASFEHVWSRHIADSAQIILCAPRAKRWVDLGSGAGFPGMVLAIQLADEPGAEVHLIESDQRKCAFLREVARATGAVAEIHPVRVESIDPGALMPVDAVTARAFAALPIVLDFAKVWLTNGAVGVFPRGKTVDAQLSGIPALPEFSFETVTSKVDAQAVILVVRQRESAQHFSRS